MDTKHTKISKTVENTRTVLALFIFLETINNAIVLHRDNICNKTYKKFINTHTQTIQQELQWTCKNNTALECTAVCIHSRWEKIHRDLIQNHSRNTSVLTQAFCTVHKGNLLCYVLFYETNNILYVFGALNQINIYLSTVFVECFESFVAVLYILLEPVFVSDIACGNRGKTVSYLR